MKVALVHDYLNEFGGAERVLLTLSKMYSNAPIYTAFYKKGSQAYRRFKDKDIRPSWAQSVPGFVDKLHSPLRFLSPLIWESFDLSEYDLVISSASWYITKGIITRPETVHICYCHTPPRYLYGYSTSIEWQKYWLVRQYAKIVNLFLRKYDFQAAQRVDYFVANSENTRKRIQKFYRREARVIYPPVELPQGGRIKRGNYYLAISRIVGGKGLKLAVEVANELKLPLKVVGAPAGWGGEDKKLREMAGSTVEFLGYVEDEELAGLYGGAKAFLALAKDEDFGITPVEAMAMGTPVVAFNGGGYKETVVEGKTGVFFNQLRVKSLIEAIRRLDQLNIKEADCKERARKFSKQRFVDEMNKFVDKKYKEHFLVYKRDGKKCSRCGGKIKKTKIGGKGTFYCVKCQI